MAPWAPRRTRAEAGKPDCQSRYDLEMESRKVGWGDPALAYNEEKDLFRLTDERFAFSREHADWELLRKWGRLRASGNRRVAYVSRNEGKAVESL